MIIRRFLHYFFPLLQLDVFLMMMMMMLTFSPRQLVGGVAAFRGSGGRSSRTAVTVTTRIAFCTTSCTTTVRSSTDVPAKKRPARRQQQVVVPILCNNLRPLCSSASFDSSSSSSSIKKIMDPTSKVASSANQTTTTLRSLVDNDFSMEDGSSSWEDVLPLSEGSHNSAKLVIPPPKTTIKEEEDDPFDKTLFRKRLDATLTLCRQLEKSSLWVEIHMSRARLMEDMQEFGLRFHHAVGETAVLNVWLKENSECKVPSFATHHVGVGAVVVSSRNEILCVRELRRNYLPWKTPTGLADLGEPLHAAAEREVWEETGIRATFHSVIGFRQTHGVAHGRSDLFFVCRLDPVETVDEDGNAVIPEPVIQKCEIETAAWVPLDEYRAMVNGDEQNNKLGHPMMKHVLESFDAGRKIEHRIVESVVPGRSPNSIFFPT